MEAQSAVHVATASLNVGHFQWTGSGTVLDLIAASTNSLNGALLARRPDHYKNFTVVGILVMALLMGLGGGVTRDILLNQVPAAFTNPAYWVVAIGFGVLGYFLAYSKGQLFREGFFQFVISFSLPWYAMVGVYKGVQADLPVVAAIGLGVIATTAGRWYVDLSSGVTPKQFIRGEWWIPIATLAASVWVLTYWVWDNVYLASAIAFVVAYVVRVLALWYAWEEPLAKEPKGVYIHSDGRPMLGRKLKDKSQRELRDLGLVVERAPDASPTEAANPPAGANG